LDFSLNEDQRAIQDMARSFTADMITPEAHKWDEDKVWPADVAKAAGELGFGSIYVSEEGGGCGLSRVESVLIFEQLSMGCPSTAAMISIHNMATWMIDCFGNDDQRARFVGELSTLRRWRAIALPNPARAVTLQASRPKRCGTGANMCSMAPRLSSRVAAPAMFML